MKTYCVICRELTLNFNRHIVGICRELKQPVCAKHAEGCRQDGHGFDPLRPELKFTPLLGTAMRDADEHAERTLP